VAYINRTLGAKPSAVPSLGETTSVFASKVNTAIEIRQFIGELGSDEWGGWDCCPVLSSGVSK